MPTAPGHHTRAEIAAFADVWRTAAQAAISVPTTAAELRVIGCGSAYFAGQTLAAFAQMIQPDRPALALPASEVWLHADQHLSALRAPLTLALSRSGSTSETLRAVETMQARFPDQPCVLLTCTAGSPLTRLQRAHDSLIVLPIQEQSVVQTSSLGALLLTAMRCLVPSAAFTLPDADAILPDMDAIRAYFPLAAQLGTHPGFDRFCFLGSGVKRGLASEAMLKLKEMTFCFSEAFHPLELRHGLGTNVTNRTLITLFCHGDPTIDAHELALLAEFRQRGAHTLTLAWDGMALPPVTYDRDYRMILPAPSGLPGRTIAFLPLIQQIGLHRALTVSRNPDQPDGLTAFITLPTPSTGSD